MTKRKTPQGLFLKGFLVEHRGVEPLSRCARSASQQSRRFALRLRRSFAQQASASLHPPQAALGSAPLQCECSALTNDTLRTPVFHICRSTWVVANSVVAKVSFRIHIKSQQQGCSDPLRIPEPMILCREFAFGRNLPIHKIKSRQYQHR